MCANLLSLPMTHLKIAILGIFLSIALGCHLTAVFTKYWIRLYRPDGGILDHLGIVPFRNSEPILFAIASWLMFISFACFVVISLIYITTINEVQRIGYRHSIRNVFIRIVSLCFLLAALQLSAFILMASYTFHEYISDGSAIECLLGFSAYLALISATVSVLSMGIAGHIARKDCQATDEKEPVG